MVQFVPSEEIVREVFPLPNTTAVRASNTPIFTANHYLNCPTSTLKNHSQEAPGPVDGGVPALAPAAGPPGNSSAPIPSAVGVTPAPELLSPAEAPSPNATAARPPVVGMGFDMGGQTPEKKPLWGRKMR